MLLLTTTTTNSCILPLIHKNDNHNKQVAVITATENDDDSSTCSSSTVSVLDLTTHGKPPDDGSAPPLTNRMEDRLQQQQQQQQQVLPCKTITKTVRFNISANQYHDNTQMSDKQDCKRLWYTARDYNDFKSADKMLVAQIVAQGEQQRRTRTRTQQMHMFPLDSSLSSSCSYHDILYRTYEACCNYPLTHPIDEADIDDMDESITSSSSSFSSLSDRVNLVDYDDDDETQDQLRQWLDLATARLGLERSAVRRIARDRYYRYKDLVRVILDIQTTWEQECNDNDDDDEFMTTEQERDIERAEYLRQASQAITRPSRLFARQLAQAQAAPLC